LRLWSPADQQSSAVSVELQVSTGMVFAACRQSISHERRESSMLKFLGGTIGVIFLIGLIVVILLLMLIF
jgi:phosphotransferase system  glucose/maltose/N-acetylglucosamine-specific IIC component